MLVCGSGVHSVRPAVAYDRDINSVAPYTFRHLKEKKLLSLQSVCASVSSSSHTHTTSMERDSLTENQDFNLKTDTGFASVVLHRQTCFKSYGGFLSFLVAFNMVCAYISVC